MVEIIGLKIAKGLASLDLPLSAKILDPPLIIQRFAYTKRMIVTI